MRALARSREPFGRPPTTSTRHCAPIAAASSTARRLSSSAARREAASAAWNMPPRQSPVTVMPCARMSLPARSAPHACTMSRQGEIAEMPARAQPSRSSTNDHAFTVIELIESSARSCERSRITLHPLCWGLHTHASPAGLTRGSIFFARRWIAGSNPAMTKERGGARGTQAVFAYPSRLHAARRQHGAHAQRGAVGIGEKAGGVGEAEQLGEMQRRACALLAADQGEMILQAVEIRHEHHAGLVEARRRLEDVARER